MNRESSNCKLFVGGLNQLTTEVSLKQYFNQFGSVDNVHIKRDDNLRSKGYGVVSFSDPSGVEATLVAGDHYLDGNRIDPKRFDFDAYTAGTPEDDACKLFIGGLNPVTTEADVRKYFSRFGMVRGILLKKDPVSGKCRGYAFLTFETPDGVAAVLKESSHVISGKTVDAKPFKGKPGKIFVGGINRDCTTDEIRGYFSQFGSIIEFNLPLDFNNPGKNKGYCFITFESESCVRNCLSKDTHPVIRGKAVDVKRAVPQQQNSDESPNFGHAGPTGAYGGFGPRATGPSSAGIRPRGGPPGQAGGCPYCGGPGPVINPPRLWPPAPMGGQPQGGLPNGGAGNNANDMMFEDPYHNSSNYSNGVHQSNGGMSPQNFSGYGGYGSSRSGGVMAAVGPTTGLNAASRVPAPGRGFPPAIRSTLRSKAY